MTKRVFSIDLVLLLSLGLVQSSLGIINGQYAGTPIKDEVTGEIVVKNEGQFPYIVAVEKSGVYKCGGVILTCNLVLTAGHCVDNVHEADLSITAGSLRRDDARDVNRQISKVKLIKRHPQYNRQGPTHDLAVLVLKKELHLNDFVKPILLPERNANFVGKKVTVLGWGMQNGPKARDLQKAILKVIDLAKCQKNLRYKIDSSVVCAIDEPEYKRGHTKGDSGGPLLLRSSSNEPKKDVLVGIVSFLTKTENQKPDTHKPFIYANVQEMLSWVKEIINLHKVKTCFRKSNV